MLILSSEEHQRRSPDCIFFTLSAPIKSQGGRSKRGRASKASRLSTQSNFTAASKDASIAETELHVNETVPSTTEDTRESKAKGNKKASKSKKPAAKPKSKSKPSELEVEEPVLASSYIEPEDDDFEVKVDIQPTSLARAGKKRNSDEMNAANVGGLSTEADKTIRQPPPKRRATRTRSSVAPESTPLAPSQQNEVGDIHMTDAEDAVASSVPALGKAGKRGKKRASSTARKASTTSTASKASLRLAIPDDEDLDAALELDLDRPLTDEEGNADSLEPVQPKGRRLTRSKPAPLKGMASVASTRRGTRASTITIDDSSIEDVAPSWPTAMKAREASLDVPEPEADVKDSIMEPKTKGKGIRKTATRKVSKKAEAQDDVAQKENEQARPEGTDIFNDTAAPKAPKPQGRQTSRQLPARTTRTSSSATSHTAATLDHHLNSSMLDAQTAEDDSGHETDASVATQGPGKRVGRGKGVKKPKKAKAGKNGPLMSSNIEDVVHPKMNKTDNEAVVVEIDAQSSDQPADEAPEEPRKAGRKAKVGAKTSKGKKSAPKPGAAPTQSPTASPKEKQPIAAFVEDFPTAPSAQITHSTPPLAPSPQSSDAENQPPSSRPSALRPPLAVKSPFTSQPAHIPVAISTPTASPSKGSFSKLHSTMPWTAIDLEQIFSGTPSANQENNPFTLGVGLANGALTSPERGLTVEQWIQFNAQRGEEGLRAECERLVGKFEGEGMRALRTLEGIVCAE